MPARPHGEPDRFLEQRPAAGPANSTGTAWQVKKRDLGFYGVDRTKIGATVMDLATVNRDCVYSRLASDPDLREIVDLFVEEMPGRVATMLEQLNAADWDGLRRSSHQLRGAAGSYGFDGISPSAGKVEAAIRDGEPEQRIRETVEELVELCNRTRCGLPPQ